MKLRSIDEYELKPIKYVQRQWSWHLEIDGEDVSYESLITSDARITILKQVGTGDYQGRSFGVAKFEDSESELIEYGLFSYSYGSCNVCDELEAATFRNSITGVEDLRASLLTSIKWFTSLDEAEVYLSAEDVKGTHWYYETDFQKFARAIREVKRGSKYAY